MREAEPRELRRAWNAGLAVLAVLLLLPLRGLLRNQGPPMEEGFMLVFPERVLAGDVPNEDFLHLYGPGSLWVLAALYKVFGVALHVERLAAFAQQIGVVLGVWAVARPFGPLLATAGAALTLIIIVPPIGLTALAWVGAVAFCLWALRAVLRAVDTGSTRAATAAGLLAAAALLYRPDTIVALTLVALVVGRRLASPLRRRAFVALAAGVVPPYLVHAAMAGPGNVIQGMVLDPVVYLRGGRRLPLPPSWDQFDGFLQRAGALHEPWWPIPDLESPAQLTVWLAVLLATVVALVVVGRRWARSDPADPDPRALALLGAGVLSLGLLPQALQRADSTHLAWVACVPFGFLPALLSRWWPARRPLAAAAAVAVPLLLVPAFTFRSYGDYVAQTFGVHRLAFHIEHEGRDFYYGRPDVAAAAEELAADVERLTSPGDRMLVGTGDLRFTPYSDAYLYYLLPDRPPATYYIEMDPGVANADDSGLADEVRAADLVVLSHVWDAWDEPNDSRVVGSDEPNQVLAAEFCRAGVYGGLYELYLKCE